MFGAVNNEEMVSVPGGSIGNRSRWYLNKKVIYLLITLVLILGLLFYFRSYFIVARVNGSFISKMALDKELEKQSGQQVLDGLISKKLIEEKVKNISVNDDEVVAEMKSIKERLETQGQTLENALKTRKMTQDDFKAQITLQKKLEKLLSDKIGVTSEEVAKAIKDNKLSLPKGMSIEEFNAQISNNLKQQKLNNEISQFISSLRAQAKITYFLDL